MKGRVRRSEIEVKDRWGSGEPRGHHVSFSNPPSPRLSGVKITLWDMGGQDALRTLWKDYFLSCHGIVYVLDSEDEGRILDSRDVFLKVCY